MTNPGGPLTRSLRALGAVVALLLAVAWPSPAMAAEGQGTWAVHVSLAPTWFDPAETSGIVTPFNERNPRVRAQILNTMQQIIHEQVQFGPVIEPAFLNGVGPRLEMHGLGAIANHPYSGPYEDLRLKK